MSKCISFWIYISPYSPMKAYFHVYDVTASTVTIQKITISSEGQRAGANTLNRFNLDASALYNFKEEKAVFSNCIMSQHYDAAISQHYL